jgi:hypothetical protein
MKRIAVSQRGVGTLCLTMLLVYFTAQIAMAPPVPGATALVRISILLRCLILARSSATGLDSVATGLDLLTSKHISFTSGNIMTNGSPATSGELERKSGSHQDVTSAIAAHGLPVHTPAEQLVNGQQQQMTPCETAKDLKDLEFKDAYDTLMHPQQHYIYDTHSSPGLISSHARYTYDPHSSSAQSHARLEEEDNTKHVFVSDPTESLSFAASRQRGRSLLRETYWPKQNRQPLPPRVGGGGGGSRSGGLLKCQHPDCPRIAGFFLSPRPRLSKSESQPPINNELASSFNEVTSSASSVYLDRGKTLLRRYSSSIQALVRLL